MFRNIISIMGVLLTLLSSQAFSVTPVDQTNRVDAFIKGFVQAYENRDLNKIVDSYSLNAVAIGTGQDEILKGRKQIAAGFKKDFAQHLNATIQVKRISVLVENNLAIASYNLNTNVQLPNKHSFKSQLRMSLVLMKDHQTWRILQSHLSAPMANQEKGKAFPQSKLG